MSHKVSFLVWSVLALTSATASAQYPHPSARYPDEYHDDPPRYTFKYKVKDDYGNDYGHEESRDGYETTGAYYVLLPDGRTQWVRYYVTPDSGFVAEVSYDGEPHYPHPHQPGPIQEENKPYGLGHGSPPHGGLHGSGHRGTAPHAPGHSAHPGYVQKVDRPHGLPHTTTGYHHDRKLHPADPHNPVYGAKINPYAPGTLHPKHTSKNLGEKYPNPRHPKPHHKKPYTPGQPSHGGHGTAGFRNPHLGRPNPAFPERIPPSLAPHPRGPTTQDFYPRDAPLDAFDAYRPSNSIY